MLTDLCLVNVVIHGMLLENKDIYTDLDQLEARDTFLFKPHGTLGGHTERTSRPLSPRTWKLSGHLMGRDIWPELLLWMTGLNVAHIRKRHGTARSEMDSDSAQDDLISPQFFGEEILNDDTYTHKHARRAPLIPASESSSALHRAVFIGGLQRPPAGLSPTLFSALLNDLEKLALTLGFPGLQKPRDVRTEGELKKTGRDHLAACALLKIPSASPDDFLSPADILQCVCFPLVVSNLRDIVLKTLHGARTTT
ncbi:hypothetical protein IRJ41_008872 [Triplophysa rosa]|uniref:Uncharacterized protein n=1 Tax=Triplophysa rosa TaxID=992332 RepID=A0A9W8C8U6_TRIRA|nr:hypothetical protein IRJ41_008872 [Triplophysa rosa]